jgi:8-oxo-dGTP diphosphatase
MKDAVAIVINEAGKFLLIKRAKKDASEDYWCPVTGAVEKDETQEQAVIREAKEEVGITVEPVKKVWECLTHNKKYRLHWWLAKHTGGAISANPREVKEYRWVSVSEMPAIGKMFEADLEFFQNVELTIGREP